MSSSIRTFNWVDKITGLFCDSNYCVVALESNYIIATRTQFDGEAISIYPD